MESPNLTLTSITEESAPTLNIGVEKIKEGIQKVRTRLDGFLLHFLASSKPIGIVLIAVAILFFISTLASGMEANKKDDKNDQQRASIRGFAAASGIFMITCLALGIFLIVTHYKLLPTFMGQDAYAVWRQCF